MHLTTFIVVENVISNLSSKPTQVYFRFYKLFCTALKWKLRGGFCSLDEGQI